MKPVVNEHENGNVTVFMDAGEWRLLNARPIPGWQHGFVWTPERVELETQRGYFVRWQGDNEKLNAWNTEVSLRIRRWRAWERSRPSKPADPPGFICNIPLLSGGNDE